MKRGSQVCLVVICFLLQSYVSLAQLKMPFINNMLLGRTFDYSKSIVGNDIFSPDAQKEILTQNIEKYDHKFKLIDSSSKTMDVLDVSGELSLQVMAGVVDIQGKGSYLKSTTENENSIQVLAQTQYRTVVKRFKSSVTPLTTIDWKTAQITGEHYVDSITYGGYLIASFVFTAKKSEEKEDIKASIQGTVKAASAEVSLEGLFNKLEEQTKDNSKLSISYSSTVIPEVIPIDKKTFLDNVRDFSKQVKATNNGEGVPIMVTLKELKDLDKSRAFSITPELKSDLKKVATYYHDLKTTSDEIAKALENTRLSPGAEEQYGLFNAKIWSMNDVFFSTIDKLDLNEKDESKVKQLTPAIEAYGKDALAGQYLRQFRRLLRRYPLYEVDKSKEIQLNLGKMQEVLNKENAAFTSLKKLTSGNKVAVAFDNQDAGNYLMARGKATEMSDLMVCFSAKSNEGSRRQTFLSYATLAQKDEFYIATESNKLIIMRRGTESKFTSDFGMNDNSWHAWCFSWSNAGNLQVFKDGTKQSETKSNIAAGNKIDAGGIWMVGQAQVTVGQNDNKDKSFKGEITNVNIFETSADDFGQQASNNKCSEPEKFDNNVRSWRDFRRGKMGGVKVPTVNTACPSLGKRLYDLHNYQARRRYLHYYQS